jgi:V/A-type H+/Na+-transporting ATPase subunit A
VITSSFNSEAMVTGVNGNIISIDAGTYPVMQNEVAYVRLEDQRLKAEILRVQGSRAEMQIFEDPQGIHVGDRVELEGEMLSVRLGPGLLGMLYDGLQNPLTTLAEMDGFFLKRGRDVEPLDVERKWDFTPVRSPGETLVAGDVLGTVEEKRITHKILVPFGEPGELELLSIESGEHTIEQPIARIRDAAGRVRHLTMAQHWPVRRPLPAGMLRRRLIDRVYPSEPLMTTIRLIDTFFPIALGGTACIPGPFGAGKTVLQGLISRYCSADLVVVVACGERAGEVVETIVDFSEMEDPRGGGSLMDRTIIICNTSSMPVAAREGSLYTGITLAEYYRQMGLNILLIADSTSRWAQAMRESSGRMEEIPGEEAFPAYLGSAIKGVYERAGTIRTRDASIGSLTMIGTVSPAGGNFEEPVTQATLGTVKTFLGLSYDRAYKRFYPAVDPLISWSRYLEQLDPYFEKHIEPGWTAGVRALVKLLFDGESVFQMMQVTGEEGITLDDFVVWQKATFIDMVYLQQDAFDPVDVSTPLKRQQAVLALVREVVERDYSFEDKEQARDVFTRLTGLFKNLNYSSTDAPDYQKFRREISELLESVPSR